MKISNQYLAGFLDGEGYIGINRHAKIKDKYQQFDLRVEIVNCDQVVIQRIAKKLGLEIIRREWRKVNWKPSYRASIGGNRAARLLRRLLPYLIVKKKQAKLAIEFQQMKNQKNWKKMNPDEYNDLKDSYRQEIKQLNHRGINN